MTSDQWLLRLCCPWCNNSCASVLIRCRIFCHSCLLLHLLSLVAVVTFFCVVFCYSVAKTRKLCICIISECRINCVCPISGLKLRFHFFSPPPPSLSRHNHNYYHHHPHTTTPSSPHLSHYHFLTTPPPPGQ